MNLVGGIYLLASVTCLVLLLRCIGKPKNQLIFTALGVCIIGFLLCANCELSGTLQGQSRAFSVLLVLLAYRAVEARRPVLA